MLLQHYSVTQLKTELLNCVNAEAKGGKFALFFFGSRVNGTANERADIDVGFLAEKKLDSWTKARIKERIDNIETLYKIDFVDFGNVDARFKELVMQNIEAIHE